MQVMRRIIGKHSRKPGEGELNIGQFSTIRKYMRAARRGSDHMPDGFTRAQNDALCEDALMRHSWYRRKRAWDALRNLVGQGAAA